MQPAAKGPRRRFGEFSGFGQDISDRDPPTCRLCRLFMAMTRRIADPRMPSMARRATSRRCPTRRPSSCNSATRPMRESSAPPAVSSTCSRAAAWPSRRSSGCSSAWSLCWATSQPSRRGRRVGEAEVEDRRPRLPAAPGRPRHDEGYARTVRCRPDRSPAAPYGTPASGLKSRCWLALAGR